MTWFAFWRHKMESDNLFAPCILAETFHLLKTDDRWIIFDCFENHRWEVIPQLSASQVGSRTGHGLLGGQERPHLSTSNQSRKAAACFPQVKPIEITSRIVSVHVRTSEMRLQSQNMCSLRIKSSSSANTGSHFFLARKILCGYARGRGGVKLWQKIFPNLT